MISVKISIISLPEILLYRIVLGCAFLIIPIGIISPHAMIFPLIIGGACGIFTGFKDGFKGTSKLFLISLLALIGYGAISSIWSIAPFASILLSLKLLGLVILGVFWCHFLNQLEEKQKQQIVISLLAGIIFGLIFVGVDHAKGNPWLSLTGKTPAKAFSQGSLAISLAVWPCFYWLFKKDILGKILLAVFAMSTLLILTKIDCDTSFVVLVLGGLAALAFTIWYQSCWVLLKTILPLSIFITPFIALTLFSPQFIPKYNEWIRSPSYIERFYLWNAAAREIKKNPILGYGMGSTPFLDPSKEVMYWSYLDKMDTRQEVASLRIPLHSHNIALQYWLELGMIGMIIGTWFLLATLLMIQRAQLNRTAEIFCIGFFINALGIAWISLGIWQNWWIACLWLVGGILSTIVCSDRKLPLDQSEKVI